VCSLYGETELENWNRELCVVEFDVAHDDAMQPWVESNETSVS
jgi:hypothetical protein